LVSRNFFPTAMATIVLFSRFGLSHLFAHARSRRGFYCAKAPVHSSGPRPGVPSFFLPVTGPSCRPAFFIQDDRHRPPFRVTTLPRPSATAGPLQGQPFFSKALSADARDLSSTLLEHRERRALQVAMVFFLSLTWFLSFLSGGRYTSFLSRTEPDSLPLYQKGPLLSPCLALLQYSALLSGTSTSRVRFPTALGVARLPPRSPV